MKAAEQRGDKTKKKPVIDAKAAETVKLVFKLFLEGDGAAGPLGVKHIAKWLNARGYKTPTGKAFYTSRVRAVLISETHARTALFNRKDTKTDEILPRHEWIPYAVPQI